MTQKQSRMKMSFNLSCSSKTNDKEWSVFCGQESRLISCDEWILRQPKSNKNEIESKINEKSNMSSTEIVSKFQKFTASICLTFVDFNFVFSTCWPTECESSSVTCTTVDDGDNTDWACASAHFMQNDIILTKRSLSDRNKNQFYGGRCSMSHLIDVRRQSVCAMEFVLLVAHFASFARTRISNDRKKRKFFFQFDFFGLRFASGHKLSNALDSGWNACSFDWRIISNLEIRLMWAERRVRQHGKTEAYEFNICDLSTPYGRHRLKLNSFQFMRHFN